MREPASGAVRTRRRLRRALVRHLSSGSGLAPTGNLYKFDLALYIHKNNCSALIKPELK